MPKMSVWLIRAALLHFVMGALLGSAYLCWKAAGWFPWSLSHVSVHVELMLVGWMVQLVIGVAYWILPRPADEPRDAHEGVMWAVFGMINAGVLLASLGGDPSLPRQFQLAGRILEIAAAGLFALHAWNRQRPYRAKARKVLI